MMSDEALSDRIGRLADKADNFTHAAALRVSDRIHVEALTGGMRDIRDELREVYRGLTGDDPWSDPPAETAEVR